MAEPLQAGTLKAPAADMAEEVRHGLTAPRPWLPCKYFYDDRGSELFERITALPEYYQTRTEEALLARVADEIVTRTRPLELVELGSGAGRKIGLVLNAVLRAGAPPRVLLFDINAAFVEQSARLLAARFPGLAVRGVAGDFLRDLPALGPGGGRLVLFFGGTIGNLHPSDAPRFLARLARQLEPGDALLVGVDLVKDTARLEAAYNDAAGVTAAFNRNMLAHVNDALDADFDVGAWEHVAFYDAREAWIEMRLRATRACHVSVPGTDLELDFARGDEISTEISCKYTRQSFGRLLPRTGLAMERWHTDAEDLFALTLLRRMRLPVRLQ
ncbi:MAG: dimethylhistidine N-methyltransferase [Gemmatimonadetes bacterium GWC2_71_10]|nr:MAG: dimethylhistidine N-methyltransferase [Gemmatimonadetes bacterium GWC2_71_10]